MKLVAPNKPFDGQKIVNDFISVYKDNQIEIKQVVDNFIGHER